MARSVIERAADNIWILSIPMAEKAKYLSEAGET